MWIDYVFQNGHFAVHLMASFVFFTVFWLYADSWVAKKRWSEFLLVIGYLLGGLGYLGTATIIDTGQVTQLRSVPTLTAVTHVLLSVGYVCIALGLWRQGIQDKPRTRGILEAYGIGPVVAILPFMVGPAPILAAIVSYLYLRRSTIGYERHLLPMAGAFGLLSVSHLLGISALYRHSSIIWIAELTRVNGVFWVLEHLILLAGVVIAGRWVWGYLVKQIQTQVFLVMTTTVLGVFLVTAVTFTGLLLRELRGTALTQVTSATSILAYAINSKLTELIADAELLADSPEFREALVADDILMLSAITRTVSRTKLLPSVIIVDESGKVRARSQDPERIGGSIGQSDFLDRTAVGQPFASVYRQEGILSPEMLLRIAVAVPDSGDGVLGYVTIDYPLDSAFLDGIRDATGLESGVYGDDILSASSIRYPGTSARFVGMKLTDERILDQVLTRGEPFAGDFAYLHLPYFAAFQPLTDIDGVPVGMLFVGYPQSRLMTLTQTSFTYTFLLVAFLFVLSYIPLYIVSHRIAEQVK